MNPNDSFAMHEFRKAWDHRRTMRVLWSLIWLMAFLLVATQLVFYYAILHWWPA